MPEVVEASEKSTRSSPKISLNSAELKKAKTQLLQHPPETADQMMALITDIHRISISARDELAGLKSRAETKKTKAIAKELKLRGNSLIKVQRPLVEETGKLAQFAASYKPPRVTGRCGDNNSQQNNSRAKTAKQLNNELLRTRKKAAQKVSVVTEVVGCEGQVVLKVPSCQVLGQVPQVNQTPPRQHIPRCLFTSACSNKVAFFSKKNVPSLIKIKN